MICEQGSDPTRVRPVQIRYSAHPIYFEQLAQFGAFAPNSLAYARLGSAYAKLRFAWRISGPPQATQIWRSRRKRGSPFHVWDSFHCAMIIDCL